MIGRNLTLTWGGSAVAKVREKSAALNGEAVDLSSDDDNGWRALDTGAGQNEVNLSLSGVLASDALKTDWFDGDRTKAVALTYPDGGVLAGNFYLASYTETAPYNEAVTFECELQSSGAVTYTPAA